MNFSHERLSDLFSKLKKDKKALALILICAAGIAIILFSEMFFGDTAKEKSVPEKTSEMNISDPYEYAELMENKLTDIVSSISGAGKAKVMITLDGSAESVYAQNSKTGSENGDREKNSDESKYVLVKNESSKEEALLLKIMQPRILGVAIVCEGGDSAYVQEKIIATVSALFDISSSKINVTKLAS